MPAAEVRDLVEAAEAAYTRRVVAKQAPAGTAPNDGTPMSARGVERSGKQQSGSHKKRFVPPPVAIAHQTLRAALGMARATFQH